MPWHGWFDAAPLAVHISSDARVEVHLGDRLLATRQLQWAEEYRDGDKNALVRFPRGVTAPRNALFSWVNERGHGRILTSDGPVIACHLTGFAGVKRAPSHHPKAAFWLSIAASIQHRPTIESLAALTGYSYPTCFAWVRQSVRDGMLLDVGQRGRRRIYRLSPVAAAFWWKSIRQWWGRWRSPKWPKLHGPVSVHYIRADRRLPAYCLEKDGRSSKGWPSSHPTAGHIWATGADYFAAVGKLVQTRDTDIWCSQSAWKKLPAFPHPLQEPADPFQWEGIRATVMDDDHPLMRMLWFHAGVSHPAWGNEFDPREENQPRDGLLRGLPLLDAENSPDARVATLAKNSLNDLFGQLLDSEQ